MRTGLTVTSEEQIGALVEMPAGKVPTVRVAVLGDAGHVNVQRWCEGLSRAGAEVHLISFRDGPSRGWQIHLLPPKRQLGKIKYIVSVPRVRRLIGKICPQVVVAYYVTGYGTLGSLCRFRPLVQVTSGSDVLLVRNALMRLLVRFNLAQADMVTAWAPHMAEAAREFGVDEERIMVLPRGIPAQAFVRCQRSAPTRGESIRIISTRSLESDYNTARLIDSIGILLERGIRCTLTLAGDGSQRRELVTQTRELGLEDHVSFMGFVRNDELPALLGGHDLYVALSESDGVSASLLEAMAVGLLPIVPNHAANRLWIEHRRNGLLLDAASPVAVADAIEEAAADLPMQRRAWQQNSETVRERADLYRNSELFVASFHRLASKFRGQTP